mmetsp:Transcript_6664/g.15837  ORF Transcript_6664/g.15837 Transcript_6664/m.15837 type:complete len:332 (-) Transcript_6664:173-1168(-)
MQQESPKKSSKKSYKPKSKKSAKLFQDLLALRRLAHEKFERSRGLHPRPAEGDAGCPTDDASPLQPLAPPCETSPAKVRSRADDPEEVVAIAEAGQCQEVLHALDVLTTPGKLVRGCRVDPARPRLQALQNVLGWTQGGYDTRPAEGIQQQKMHDRMQVLLTYRQPPAPEAGEEAPSVAMYDYLCDTLFGIPMRPVGPEVPVFDVQDFSGNIVHPCWIEADWETFRASGAKRPAPVFRPNRYPYQLPSRDVREGAHEFQRQTQHWILWYFHQPDEPLPDPDDLEIDDDLRCALLAVATGAGFEAFDYIWYRNPGMTVPDMFHVQVFWIVPE